MNENSDLLPNLAHEDAFEVQMRGYSRRQVDEFVARSRSQVRELEERLSRTLDEGEQLRQEVKALRQQALGSRPAHEEVSERIAQILKLADDEAKAQKNQADDEIRKHRSDAQQEADRARKEARDQAERMLTTAQEQAERAISAARAEAEKTRNTSRAEADRMVDDARKKAENMLTSAKAQAKKTLDEVTARATAIHDGAERRLNLLSTRHAETIRRLNEILDGVSSLVASETARLSLEEEVEQTVAKTIEELAADGEAPTARTEGKDGGEPAARTPAAAVTDPPGPGNQRGTTPAAVQGAAQAAPPQAHAPVGSPAGPGRPAAAGAVNQAPGRPANTGSGTAPLPVVHDARQATSAPVNPAPRAGTPGMPGGQARAAGPDPAAQSPSGSGGSRTAPEDHVANRLPNNGPAGDRHTSAAPGNRGAAIDADEVTEGVRIVREQRQR
jgi:cell division septum initiation protein DivIVA